MPGDRSRNLPPFNPLGAEYVVNGIRNRQFRNYDSVHDAIRGQLLDAEADEFIAAFSQRMQLNGLNAAGSNVQSDYLF
jgi:hypothetical protein